MARRKRGERGTGSGRVTPRFSPHRERDRVLVEAGVGLRLHDPVPSGTEAVVVPCCGNATEFDGLGATGIPLVRYDVRNRGASDSIANPQRLGFARDVEDLVAVCDVLGLERVSIVAWSYHVAAAIQLALDHPERVDRLVLAAAVPAHSTAEADEGRTPTPAQLAQLDQLQADGLPSRDPEAWCEAWRAVYVPLRMGRPERFDQLARVCHLPNERPANVARTVISVLGDLHPYDWRVALRELRAPVLVVHGTADPDPLAHAEEWVQVVPDSRLLVLEGVGTIPWVEDADRFFAVSNRFLRGEPV